MTPETVQFLTITEDRRRWHDQRYRTVSDLIAIFIRADYRLSDLANLDETPLLSPCV